MNDVSTIFTVLGYIIPLSDSPGTAAGLHPSEGFAPSKREFRAVCQPDKALTHTYPKGALPKLPRGHVSVQVNVEDFLSNLVRSLPAYPFMVKGVRRVHTKL